MDARGYQNYKQKTDHGFKQRNTDMGEQGLVQYHSVSAEQNFGRTAENEGINQIQSGSPFPDSQK